MCAHVDRRQLSVYFAVWLPHVCRPEEFGRAEDCELCKHVEISPQALAFMKVLKQNGGVIFSPSVHPDTGGYCTFLEELVRLSKGLEGANLMSTFQCETRPTGRPSRGRNLTK